jgi:hypothetical protein
MHAWREFWRCFEVPLGECDRLNVIGRDPLMAEGFTDEG